MAISKEQKQDNRCLRQAWLLAAELLTDDKFLGETTIALKDIKVLVGNLFTELRQDLNSPAVMVYLTDLSQAAEDRVRYNFDRMACGGGFIKSCMVNGLDLYLASSTRSDRLSETDLEDLAADRHNAKRKAQRRAKRKR